MAGIKEGVAHAAKTGAHIAADTLISEGKGWLGKIFGVGLGIFTGTFGGDFAQFSTSDEHEMHDAVNLMTDEEKEVFFWFTHKAFPEIGDIAIDRVTNFFQNRFRAYAVKRGGRVKDAPHDDARTRDFLLKEIVNPIRTAPDRETGFRIVMSNLSALDIPLPPAFVNEEFLETYVTELESKVNQPRGPWSRLFRL